MQNDKRSTLTLMSDLPQEFPHSSPIKGRDMGSALYAHLQVASLQEVDESIHARGEHSAAVLVLSVGLQPRVYSLAP